MAEYTGAGATNVITLRRMYEIIEKVRDAVHPIGSIYISTEATNPGTFLGGTWEQIKDKFLLAAGDTYKAGATGGEATHKLSVNEMLSHTHGVKLPYSYSNGDGTGNWSFHTVNARSSGMTGTVANAAQSTGGSGPQQYAALSRSLCLEAHGLTSSGREVLING